MAARILQSLAAVDGARSRRAATPGRSLRVAALKAWQRERLARTQADLIAHPR